MDSRIRQLERRAAYGDLEAEAQLGVVLCRASEHEYWSTVKESSPPEKPEFIAPYLMKTIENFTAWGNRRARDLDKKHHIIVQCPRCRGRMRLEFEPPIKASSTSSSGIITIPYSHVAGNSYTVSNYQGYQDYYQDEEYQDEEPSEGPYDWHPTKARPWQTLNRKAKRKATKRARKRSRK